MMLPFVTPSEVDSAIPIVMAHLDAGRLLGYPTETVYGLGSAAAVAPLKALAELKGRPERKPFLLLVSGYAMAEEAGLQFTEAARVLAQAFWPGPLTLVLRGGEGRLPEQLRGPEGGIAVRFTSQAAIAKLVSVYGRPLTSTSANRPGGPTAPGAAAIVDLFSDAVASGELLVLDGGVLGVVPPSTIVDCTTPVARLVRAGAIPRDELRRFAGRLAP
jgi:L-threonylcarbamoyladenylate synthase